MKLTERKGTLPRLPRDGSVAKTILTTLARINSDDPHEAGLAAWQLGIGVKHDHKLQKSPSRGAIKSQVTYINQLIRPAGWLIRSSKTKGIRLVKLNKS